MSHSIVFRGLLLLGMEGGTHEKFILLSISSPDGEWYLLGSRQFHFEFYSYSFTYSYETNPHLTFQTKRYPTLTSKATHLPVVPFATWGKEQAAWKRLGAALAADFWVAGAKLSGSTLRSMWSWEAGPEVEPALFKAVPHGPSLCSVFFGFSSSLP